MNDVQKQVQKIFLQTWHNEIIKNNQLAKANQQNPQAFVLGGQPGAGKANLTKNIMQILHKNIVEINGDNFRKYHPNYKEFQEKYQRDSPKYTATFTSVMTDAILKKLIAEKYNIVIEGTFRTAQTPIDTLQNFKNNGYKTNVFIQTCDKNISWQSCLERYKKMLEVNAKEARYTDKAHHDLVVENLANNIEMVYRSGLADKVQIFVKIPVKNQENKVLYKEFYHSDSGIPFDKIAFDKFIGNN